MHAYIHTYTHTHTRTYIPSTGDLSGSVVSTNCYKIPETESICSVNNEVALSKRFWRRYVNKLMHINNNCECFWRRCVGKLMHILGNFLSSVNLKNINIFKNLRRPSEWPVLIKLPKPQFCTLSSPPHAYYMLSSPPHAYYTLRSSCSRLLHHRNISRTVQTWRSL
jgi:hypothetical protein